MSLTCRPYLKRAIFENVLYGEKTYLPNVRMLILSVNLELCREDLQYSFEGKQRFAFKRNMNCVWKNNEHQHFVSGFDE